MGAKLAVKCKGAEIKEVMEVGDPWFISLVLYESNYRMAYRIAIEYPDTLKSLDSKPNVLPIYFNEIETARIVMKFLIAQIIKVRE